MKSKALRLFAIRTHCKVEPLSIKSLPFNPNFNEYGCIVYRPSFRGLGGSEGIHDEGHGETEDILAVIEHVRKLHEGLPFMQAV